MIWNKPKDKSPIDPTVEDISKKPVVWGADDWYHYCVVRRDLEPGHQHAQLMHATGRSVSNSWLPSGTRAVVLGVKSEHELIDLHLELEKHYVKHEFVYEDEGRYGGQFTAIGFEPQKKIHLAPYLGELRTL